MSTVNFMRTSFWAWFKEIKKVVKLDKLIKEINADSTRKLVLSPQESGLLYTPNPAQYGGAYVLLPKGDGWEAVQKKVKGLLFIDSNKK